jgi:hypothetical protein
VPVPFGVSGYAKGDLGGLYRLGIATHAFVDTWAHQNFAGCRDHFNAIDDTIVPNIGHAEGFHHPDLVGHRWNDNRLANPEINNNERFMGAARRLYEIYAGFQTKLGKSEVKPWEQLEKILTGIFNITYSEVHKDKVKERQAKYKSEVGDWLDNYDAGDWLLKSVDVEMVHDISTDQFKQKHIWKSDVNKTTTDWYKFQEAIKEYVANAKETLKNVVSFA